MEWPEFQGLLGQTYPGQPPVRWEEIGLRLKFLFRRLLPEPREDLGRHEVLSERKQVCQTKMDRLNIVQMSFGHSGKSREGKISCLDYQRGKGSSSTETSNPSFEWRLDESRTPLKIKENKEEPLPKTNNHQVFVLPQRGINMKQLSAR